MKTSFPERILRKSPYHLGLLLFVQIVFFWIIYINLKHYFIDFEIIEITYASSNFHAHPEIGPNGNFLDITAENDNRVYRISGMLFNKGFHMKDFQKFVHPGDRLEVTLEKARLHKKNHRYLQVKGLKDKNNNYLDLEVSKKLMTKNALSTAGLSVVLLVFMCYYILKN